MFISNGSLVGLSGTIDGGVYGSAAVSTSLTVGYPAVYSSMYRSQLWVYTVVNKLSNGQARLPLPVYRHDDLNRPRADNHPMAKLLARPNPSMSSFDFWFSVSATKELYGWSCAYKQRSLDGTPVALFLLHPTCMTRNQDGTWTYRNGVQLLENIPETDLIIFRHYNPDLLSPYGLSPLEPLRKTLENEWSAREATSSFWARGGRPGAVLTHPKRLSQPAAAALSQRFDALTGGSGATGKTLVLEEGMKFEPLTLTAEEAQYIETRKLNREEVCGAYDIPPPAVHILDHATFSNITEQMRSVYRDTQAPRLKASEAAIEQQLRSVDWPDDDVYAEFLMDEVLRGDFEARQTALKMADYMTLAEKRRIENLPFIEGTDRIFMNTATLPLDAIDAQAAALVANTENAPAALPAAPAA